MNVKTVQKFKENFKHLKKTLKVSKKKFRNVTNYRFIYLALISASLVIRVIDLNYNSPSADEAVYVVVGKLGIFQRDWWSYNASAWMGGSPYFYPTLTSIAYQTGQILGSRLLNVIFGVLSVELVLKITTDLATDNKKISTIAGIIGALVLCASASSIYLSRLATYDMPAYFFMLMSFYFLLLEKNKKAKSNGGYFFLSAIFALLSVLTKIITLAYLPLIVFYSYNICRKPLANSKIHFSKLYFWKRYFLSTLTLGLTLYFSLNYYSLSMFYVTQVTRESVSFSEILISFIRQLLPTLALVFFAGFGFINKKFYKTGLLLLFLASVPLILHFATQRVASLDKHVYISLIFLCIATGIGFNNILAKLAIPNKYKYGLLVITLLGYSVYSYQRSLKNNNLWINSTNLATYLKNNVKNNDLILAENGPEVTLAIYDINFPLNTTTFDYFFYNKSEDLKEYENAVNDGYFNFIELENDKASESERFKVIDSGIRKIIEENYKLAYSDNNYIVYKRNF